ncbi:sodium:calcium antiporter [Plantactinospora sp. CA-290183]|uniref:sodium:calcium antiporter n=1 Tax=Plantactinospora sp. CA-290183 TaxID=3240006 RepID=UPI003D90ECAC
MPDFLPTTPWAAGPSVIVFAVASLVTVLGSIRLVALGDTLADRTGWGEAVFGVVFFGVATGLSGIVMTAVTAANGHPQLGYSNAVGGIAAQTTAVVVADAFYRKVNLEHAAASLSNLLFGCLLIALLALALLGSFTPDVTLCGVHPISVVIVACYLGGLQLVRRAGAEPMWQAVGTTETRPDVPDEHGDLDRRGAGWLWGRFVLVGLFVATSGWATALAAESLVEVTGLSAGFTGGVLLGVVNGLPETVTAVAAVRRGAVTLAVAAVLGGNILDVITLVVGDIAYRKGSIYHAAGTEDLFITATGLFMTAVLLGGLLVRQSCGWGRLGFEGILLFASYAAMTALLAT